MDSWIRHLDTVPGATHQAGADRTRAADCPVPGALDAARDCPRLRVRSNQAPRRLRCQRPGPDHRHHRDRPHHLGLINSDLKAFDAGTGFGYTISPPPQPVGQVDLSKGRMQAEEGKPCSTWSGHTPWRRRPISSSSKALLFHRRPVRRELHGGCLRGDPVQRPARPGLCRVDELRRSRDQLPASPLPTYDSIFTTPANHVGITFLASAGDDGAGSSNATQMISWVKWHSSPPSTRPARPT